jgi:hypothetical protein
MSEDDIREIVDGDEAEKAVRFWRKHREELLAYDG